MKLTQSELFSIFCFKNLQSIIHHIDSTSINAEDIGIGKQQQQE